MKKAIAIVAALAAFSIAAESKCSYDDAIVKFEKRMNYVELMKGAEVKVFKEPNLDGAMIRKSSNPIPSGKFMGLKQSEAFFFGGCRLVSVTVTKSKPGTKEIVAQASVYLWEDGTTPRAACDRMGNVTVINPVTEMMEPNKDCICYDKNGMERDFGKFGCLRDFEIDEMNEHNRNSGGGIIGKLKRNGTRIKQ